MALKRALRIALIPGDGIGKEVVPYVVPLLQKFSKDFDISYITLDAGWECFKKHHISLPNNTIDTLTKCDAAIFGAVSSPSGKVAGYKSPIVQLRKIFKLYGNVRPSLSLPISLPGNVLNTDMVVVRENTECLYTGEENEYYHIGMGNDTFEENDMNTSYHYATCLRTISEPACRRIAFLAGTIALQRSKLPVVTIAHKANVMPLTDGLFLRICRETLKNMHANIIIKDQLVDSLAMKMVQDPTQYNVIVAPNFHGDILSDIASGLTGGLGISAGLNVGENLIMAEPVHGSAPDIEGKGIANPIATFRSVGMMLDHLANNSVYSTIINKAITDVFVNDRDVLTPDLLGKGTTESTAKAVLDRII